VENKIYNIVLSATACLARYMSVRLSVSHTGGSAKDGWS